MYYYYEHVDLATELLK